MKSCLTRNLSCKWCLLSRFPKYSKVTPCSVIFHYRALRKIPWFTFITCPENLNAFQAKVTSHRHAILVEGIAPFLWLFLNLQLPSPISPASPLLAHCQRWLLLKISSRRWSLPIQSSSVCVCSCSWVSSTRWSRSSLLISPLGNIQSKSHASAKQKERELSAFGLVLLTTLMLRNSFRKLTRRYIRFSSVLSTSHPNKISTLNMARLVSSPAVAFATKLSSLPLLSHGLALSPIIFSVVLKQ